MALRAVNDTYDPSDLGFNRRDNFRCLLGVNNSADENFNQFNVDFVYTWQFAPGSFLNLIWKESAFAGDFERGGTFRKNLDKTFRPRRTIP